MTGSIQCQCVIIDQILGVVSGYTGGWTDLIFQRVASMEPSPERVAGSSEVAALLAPAMEELSGMERIAFVMRHYEGVPVEGIAKALGIREGAAKHAVFRAVQKIRRALEPAVSLR